MKNWTIHPDTHIGAVSLTTANLDRALRFYKKVIGFRLLRRHKNVAQLGVDVGVPLLVLIEQPDAPPKPPRSTGLYHFAVRVPRRVDLARVLRHLIETHRPLPGAADHLVSEALYLDDPDGNGIEVYVDRPRDAWPQQNGQLQMDTQRLDVDSLLKELPPDEYPASRLPSQTEIGHVHLQVADLPQAEAFYRDVLGFDLVLRYGPSAAFFSAGGYHHHIGINTWAGVGALTPPPGAVGLQHFAISLPHQDALQRTVEQVKGEAIALEERDGGFLLHDPSGNGVLLKTG